MPEEEFFKSNGWGNLKVSFTFFKKKKNHYILNYLVSINRRNHEIKRTRTHGQPKDKKQGIKVWEICKENGAITIIDDQTNRVITIDTVEEEMMMKSCISITTEQQNDGDYQVP